MNPTISPTTTTPGPPDSKTTPPHTAKKHAVCRTIDLQRQYGTVRVTHHRTTNAHRRSHPNNTIPLKNSQV